MDVDYVRLGEQIKLWRQKRGFTQERLAEMVELSPGFISLIETGKKKMSLKTLLLICEALDVRPNDLLVSNVTINQTNTGINHKE